MIRLRPVHQSHLPRRRSEQGFAGGAAPETVVVADPLTVLTGGGRLAVAPGVADPLGERARWSRAADRYDAGAVSIARLPAGLVDASTLMACPSEREYVRDSVVDTTLPADRGYRVLDGEVLEHDDDRVAERDGRVMVLGARPTDYLHWLTDSLARVLALRAIDNGEIRLIAPPLRDWQLEMLALAGVEGHRLIEPESPRLERFGEVLAVTRAAPATGAFAPTAVSALADLAPAGDGRRRLYLRAAPGANRPVAEGAATLEVAARHGFEVLDLSATGISEQLAALADAEAIMSPHGDGLASIVFARSGTIVIEVAPEGLSDADALVYRRLAAIRGHAHTQLVCPFTEASDPLLREPVVDPHYLDGLLQRLLPF
jgi:hypothetical protein